MEFRNLNNSVESSVTGSREGPPIIDSGSPEKKTYLFLDPSFKKSAVTESLKA